MRDHEGRFPVTLMCRALALSPSGYYAGAARSESHRMTMNRQLVAKIRVIHAASRQTYGSLRVHAVLQAQGQQVGEHRVARLMRASAIRAKTVKKWRTTTDSAQTHPAAPNMLNRQFAVAEPNRVWGGDITYVWTAEGWLYLTIVLDLYSRMAVAWAMDPKDNLYSSARLTLGMAHPTRAVGARDCLLTKGRRRGTHCPD